MKKMNNSTGMLSVISANVALWAVIAAAGMHSAPAHAISAAYRAQLERTHTTQVMDAHQAAPAHYTPKNIKPIHVRGFGQTFRRSGDGFGYLNDSVCAIDEKNAQATSYSCGLYTVIVRSSGAVDLMQGNQYKGRMR